MKVCTANLRKSVLCPCPSSTRRMSMGTCGSSLGAGIIPHAFMFFSGSAEVSLFFHVFPSHVNLFPNKSLELDSAFTWALQAQLLPTPGLIDSKAPYLYRLFIKISSESGYLQRGCTSLLLDSFN